MHCLAVGNAYENNRAASFATDDGGKNWYANYIPGDGGSVQLNHIIYLHDNSYMAVGALNKDNQRSSSACFVTTDGGTHWLTTEIAAPDANVSALLATVNCNDQGHCVAVGQETDPTNPQSTKLISYISDDTGSTWRLSTTPPQATALKPQLSDMKCSTDMKHCTTIGKEQDVNGRRSGISYYSTDGGENWSLAEYHPSITNYAIG